VVSEQEKVSRKPLLIHHGERGLSRLEKKKKKAVSSLSFVCMLRTWRMKKRKYGKLQIEISPFPGKRSVVRNEALRVLPHPQTLNSSAYSHTPTPHDVSLNHEQEIDLQALEQISTPQSVPQLQPVPSISARKKFATESQEQGEVGLNCALSFALFSIFWSYTNLIFVRRC
jgi:hypothetical protein